MRATNRAPAPDAHAVRGTFPSFARDEAALREAAAVRARIRHARAALARSLGPVRELAVRADPVAEQVVLADGRHGGWLVGVPSIPGTPMSDMHGDHISVGRFDERRARHVRTEDELPRFLAALGALLQEHAVHSAWLEERPFLSHAMASARPIHVG